MCATKWLRIEVWHGIRFSQCFWFFLWEDILIFYLNLIYCLISMYFWWYWDDYQIWKKLFFTRGGYKKNLNQDGWNLKRNYGLLDKRWPKMMHWIFQIFGWSYSSIMAKNQAKFFLTKLFIWGFTGKNPLKWTCSEEMEAWHSAISREILEFVNWFGCPKSEPKKLSSILPKCFFFSNV